METNQTIDDSLYLRSLSIWGRFPTVDALFIVIAKWTPMVMLVLITMSAFGFGWSNGRSESPLALAAIAIISALVVRVINQPLSRRFNRPRPFETSGHKPLLHHDSGESFPSNHASGAFALSGAYLHHPPYAGILFTLAFLLAVSRIYTGLHYFTDVVAGVLNGLVISLLMSALFFTFFH